MKHCWLRIAVITISYLFCIACYAQTETLTNNARLDILFSEGFSERDLEESFDACTSQTIESADQFVTCAIKFSHLVTPWGTDVSIVSTSIVIDAIDKDYFEFSFKGELRSVGSGERGAYNPPVGAAANLNPRVSFSARISLN